MRADDLDPRNLPRDDLDPARGILIAVLIVVGLVLAIALLFRAGEARAEEPRARFELLGGGCRLSVTGDGVWHNSNYPHDVSSASMTAGCWQVGLSTITRRTARTDYGWRFAYVDFGEVSWRAVYPLVDGEQFTSMPDGSDCHFSSQPHSAHGCVGTAQHWQEHYGFSLGYFGERKAFRALTLGLELGGYLYFGRMHYRINSWPEPDAFFEGGAHADDIRGWQLTPYVGLTARHRWLYAQARLYGSIKAATHGCGDCSGISSGPAWQIAAGISVPLESPPR